MEETFRWNQMDCGVSVFTPQPGAARNVCILYLHGGGLLYGERNDLPTAYRDLLTNAGYTLVCADYPLAPETPLSEIHRCLDALWKWFTSVLMPKLGADTAFLFGRSAGAYLSLTLAGRLAQAPGAFVPSGVIDWYGYGSLSDSFLDTPSAYYRSFPPVSKSTVQSLTLDSPPTCGPKATRYALYVYARQTGSWLEMLGVGKGDVELFSLSDGQVAAMPPVFYAASTGDNDVPYAVSKSLARRLGARIATVYGLDHDFDRDTSNPASSEVYRKCLQWIDGVIRGDACAAGRRRISPP